jgi:hypothetical protein
MKTEFANRKWLTTLFVLVALMTFVVAPVAAIQQPHGEFGGPPTVSVTNVDSLGEPRPGERLFKVHWTAQPPPGTTIQSFGVRLNVKFTQNVQRSSSAGAGASATSATVVFTSVPSGVAPISFVATVTTIFTTPEASSITTKKDFDLSSTGVQGGVASGGSLPPDRPVVQISSASHLSEGVQVPDRYLVNWNVQAASTVTIEQFGASALVTYEFKQTPENPIPPLSRETRTTVGFATARQATVEVPDPPQGGTVVSIRVNVKIETRFRTLVTRSIESTREGTF